MKKLVLILLAIGFSTLGYGQKIAAGEHHSLYLCADGTVKGWGNNYNKQLGQGSSIKALPETISGINNVKSMAAGRFHTIFLKNDSTVWAIGNNSVGQLGDETNTDRNAPIQITSLTKIIAITAGQHYTIFLKNDGTVWATGYNVFGQLGTGTNSQHNAPVQITGLSNITAIAAGGAHTIFLKNDGTVWATGGNGAGQLGDGTNSDRNAPIQITGLNNITAIAAGATQTIFLKSDGTVWATGNNYRGQLGTGTNSNSNTPVQVKGLTDITAIAVGAENTIFLKSDGTVWATGDNAVGQLGTGTNSRSNTPVPVKGLTNVTAIAAGSDHTIFLKNDGTVWATGFNIYGQLGNGHSGKESSLKIPENIGNHCPIAPSKPTVDFSNFPTNICLGSTVNVNPSIQGSNSGLAINTDYSIKVAAPKAITKNSHSVFVLDSSSQIIRYNLDGTFAFKYNANGSVLKNITAFTADEKDNVYATQTADTIYTFYANGSVDFAENQFGSISDPIYNISLLPAQVNNYLGTTNGLLLTSENLSIYLEPSDKNKFTNAGFFAGIANSNVVFDNKWYELSRFIYLDRSSQELRSKKTYFNNSTDNDSLLVDTSYTKGMEYNNLSIDTTYNYLCLTSSTKNKIGAVKLDNNGAFEYFSGDIEDILASMATATIEPVGMVTTKLQNNQMQYWIADKGLGKLVRLSIYFYQVFPALPAGLTFNQLTGKIEGQPLNLTASQTYTMVVKNSLGSDTSKFTFAVTPANPVSNVAGTNKANANQDDGKTVQYISPNNCEKIIEIADSLGGTSPGYVKVSQIVYPLIGVIATNPVVRRVTQITAENQDSIKANIKISYTYDDIELYNQSRGATILTNDTNAFSNPKREMQVAVLQMHDKPDGSKEPILHSPVTAKWNPSEKMWVVNFPVTKFSDFYVADITTVTNFECNNTGNATVSSVGFYVWNGDSLFTSDTYVDTLMNAAGCDSVATLKLTINKLNINNPSINSNYKVYPNPTTGNLHIEFGLFNKETTIELFSMTGLLLKRELVSNSASAKFNIDYPAGMYCLKISNSTQQEYIKIIKR